MNRRDFLIASVAACGISGPLFRGLNAATADPWHVRCDAHRLSRVLVHAPGPETRKVLAFGDSDDPMLSTDLLEETAGAQHRQFVTMLTREGVEVLEFTEVLDEAIARAREAGQFLPWLTRVAPDLAKYEPRVTAATLVGADDRFTYANDGPDGELRSLTLPLRFLFFTRDLAVMTPSGVILSRFLNRVRAFEVPLASFLFTWSTALQRYPVVFDAEAEGVYLQGGDAIVADEHTLLLGVNNLTEEAAAPRLARKLNMDVVAVELRGERLSRRGRTIEDTWTGLRVQFLHLDTVFNLVAPKVAVATPYFLESAHSGRNPLIDVLKAMGRRPTSSRHYLEHMIRALARIGLVRVYKAGSGEPDPRFNGLKLVDFLRERGFEIHHVGGPAPETETAKHVVECVHREIRFQAANVLAVAPHRVIAAAATPKTEEALRAGGIAVTTFPADAIVRWHGGPHCLSLPLERVASDA